MQSLCTVPRRINFPQNISQIAYAVSLFPDLVEKRSALFGWIGDAVLLSVEQFHVKDIVQTVTAYAHAKVDRDDVMQAIENVIGRQAQYMDAISVSAVVYGCYKLDKRLNESIVSLLLATAEY